MLRQMHACGIGHVLIDEIVDAPSEGGNREAGCLRQRLHGSFSCGEVYGHATADEVAGIEIAKQEIGVRNGRAPSSSPISGRAWLRTGARRADLQKTDVVELGNRASASADLDQFKRRHPD